MISWLVESIVRWLAEILKNTEAKINYPNVTEGIYMVYWVLGEINHLVFFLTVFRLKAIAIYTDLKNDRAEKIMD